VRGYRSPGRANAATATLSSSTSIRAAASVHWIGGEDLGLFLEGTDCTAVAGGYISLTLLHLDLTNYNSIAPLNELKVEWP
jgi:broad specificity polyphosphatase/5'/3'-nucleotidase SurE